GPSPNATVAENRYETTADQQDPGDPVEHTEGSSQPPSASTSPPSETGPPAMTVQLTPPRHSGCKAALSPGRCSSMREHGATSPVIWRRTGPTLSMAPMLFGSSTSSTSRFARRVVHGRSSLSSAQAACHAAADMTVTWRGPGFPRKSQATPDSELISACSSVCIGARFLSLRAIPAKRPMSLPLQWTAPARDAGLYPSV